VPGQDPVWARGDLAALECPRSLIRAESEAALEQYAAWRLCGRAPVWDYPAKLVDAFLALEGEARKEEEKSSGKQHKDR
jgi:hypothetical protein